MNMKSYGVLKSPSFFRLFGFHNYENVMKHNDWGKKTIVLFDVAAISVIDGINQKRLNEDKAESFLAM